MNILIRRATIKDLYAIQTLSQALFEYERAYTNEYDLSWSHSADEQKIFHQTIKGYHAF